MDEGHENQKCEIVSDPTHPSHEEVQEFELEVANVRQPDSEDLDIRSRAVTIEQICPKVDFLMSLQKSGENQNQPELLLLASVKRDFFALTAKVSCSRFHRVWRGANRNLGLHTMSGEH